MEHISFLKNIQARAFLAVSAVTAVIPAAASAATNCGDNVNGVICNPLGTVTDVPNLVNTIMGYVTRIGGVIAIFAFIYSGYRFVAARGNTEELKTAKNIFFNTVIGVAILLGASLLASLVVSTIKNLQS
ncbi:MAG: hypothetical protein KGH93_02500 [Patescibacteria group bacterium]|nr:hypothetical protein [Patescibacteria group bacterium]MDE1946045.1 hypothetical protein [Patescibacteria group bacterium]